MNIDPDLAAAVASGIGVEVPSGSRTQALRAANERLLNGWETFGTTGLPGRRRRSSIDVSDPLSQLKAPATVTAKGRKVAILAADGVDSVSLDRVMQALAKESAVGEVVSLRQGALKADNGTVVMAQHAVLTMPSVVYDGVFVPRGTASVGALVADGDAIHYIAEAYKHCKPIAADEEAGALLEAAGLAVETADDAHGVVLGRTTSEARALPARFVAALGQHRFFNRADATNTPA